jgi:hypothetical protein
MATKKASAGRYATRKRASGLAGKKSVTKKASYEKAGAAETKTGAAKKAGKKKASAAPVKLSTSQAELLRKVGGASEPGYRFEKKAEQRTLDALHERKLIKRGPKKKESGSYHYTISMAGIKSLEAFLAEAHGGLGGDIQIDPYGTRRGKKAGRGPRNRGKS